MILLGNYYTTILLFYHLHYISPRAHIDFYSIYRSFFAFIYTLLFTNCYLLLFPLDSIYKQRQLRLNRTWQHKHHRANPPPYIQNNTLNDLHHQIWLPGLPTLPPSHPTTTTLSTNDLSANSSMRPCTWVCTSCTYSHSTIPASLL